MAPASLASSTSRGSTSASCRISAGERALPSSTPPLITSSGLVREKSRRPLAASTGSPLMKAIAVGPVSSSSGTGNPASAAARLVSVFFTTAYVVSLPSDRRSCVSWDIVSPRYSVSTAADEPWNRSVISATAAVFSWFATCLLSRARAGIRARKRETPRRRAHGAGAGQGPAATPSILRGSPVSRRDLRLGEPSGRRSSVGHFGIHATRAGGGSRPPRPASRSGRSPPPTAAVPGRSRRGPDRAPGSRAAPAGSAGAGRRPSRRRPGR